MNKTIKDSLNYALRYKIWNVFLTVLNVSSGLCTIFGISFRDAETLWSAIVVFVITTVIIFRRFFKFLIKQIERKDSNIINQRKSISKLMDELSNYRDYFSFIHNLLESFSSFNKMVRNGKFSEPTFQREMLLFCQRLKNSFEHLSKGNPIGCTYSVSIKVVKSETELANNAIQQDIELINSFRDPASFQDDTRNETIYNETRHLVSNNTAYKRVIELATEKAPLSFYINNDIESDKNYLTSSRFCYTQGKIPYKSELVVPIIPLIRNQETVMLLGFLCVTCNLKNGFKLNNQEIKLMLTITDGLYNIFSKWQRNQVAPN